MDPNPTAALGREPAMLIGGSWVTAQETRIGPEQLQGFHTGYGLSGMGGDDGVHGYERCSRRKTIYLRHEAAPDPAPPPNLG